MEIQKALNGTTLTVTLKGRLDTISAPALEAEMKTVITGISELVFDFSGIEYISSAGLRVLLACQKIMNKQGSMVLRGVNEVVLEIFEVTGFVDVLTIE